MSENVNDDLMEGLGTDDSIENEKNSLGGGGFILESGLVDLEILAAFLTLTDAGAKCFNLHAKNEDGITLKERFYMTSNKEKGQKNYSEKNGKKRYLRGFNQANGVALLCMKMNLADLKLQKKLVEMWSFEEGGMENVSVPMFVDLVGKIITVGVLKKIEDKKKNVAAQGEKADWQPTGEVKTINVMDKFFRAKDGLTVADIRAKEKEPTFRNDWDDKWTGVTQDTSTGKAGKGTGGTSEDGKVEDKKDALFSDD